MTDYQFDAFRKVFKRELSKVVEARRQRAKEEKLAKIRKRRRRATKNFGAVGANDSRRDISNNSQAPTTTCAGVNSQTALNSTLVTWLFKGYATS